MDLEFGYDVGVNKDLDLEYGAIWLPRKGNPQL